MFISPLAYYIKVFIIFNMSNFGISTTLTMDSSVYSSLDAIGKSFFKWVEIRCESRHFDFEDERELKRIKESLRRNQLKVSSLHPPGCVDIATNDEWMRMKSVREVEKTILIADRLSAKRVIVHPGSLDGIIEQSEKSLEELVEFSEEWGIVLLLENTFPGYFGSEPKELIELATKFDLPICLDTSHATAKGDRIEEFLDLFCSRITHLHISDSNMEGNDDHLIPGEGKIDWYPIEEFIAQHDGYNIFELMPSEHPEEILSKLAKITDEWNRKKISP